MMKSSLAGKYILLTRSAEQLPSLERAVQERGGIALALPCLEVRTLAENIRPALARIGSFSDVVFTSRTGVKSVREIAGDLSAALQGKRIAAVGKATAEALCEAGVETDIIPATASQEGLVEAYAMSGLPVSLLFFRAREGREYLSQALQSRGVEVETIAAYETVCPDDDAYGIITQLQNGAVDAVLLGSPKVAHHYVERIGNSLLADRPVVAVISEQVSRAAMDAGLSVQVVAKRASFAAMLDDVATYFRAR